MLPDMASTKALPTFQTLSIYIAGARYLFVRQT